jgi:hypothetical protein
MGVAGVGKPQRVQLRLDGGAGGLAVLQQQRTRLMPARFVEIDADAVRQGQTLLFAYVEVGGQMLRVSVQREIEIDIVDPFPVGTAEPVAVWILPFEIPLPRSPCHDLRRALAKRTEQYHKGRQDTSVALQHHLGR